MLETMTIKNGNQIKQELEKSETAFIGMSIETEGYAKVKEILMKEWKYSSLEAYLAINAYLEKAN